MQGRPGIFWGVELGALASLAVLLWLFRRETQLVCAKVCKNFCTAYTIKGQLVFVKYEIIGFMSDM